MSGLRFAAVGIDVDGTFTELRVEPVDDTLVATVNVWVRREGEGQPVAGCGALRRGEAIAYLERFGVERARAAALVQVVT